MAVTFKKYFRQAHCIRFLKLPRRCDILVQKIEILRPSRVLEITYTRALASQVALLHVKWISHPLLYYIFEMAEILYPSKFSQNIQACKVSASKVELSFSSSILHHHLAKAKDPLEMLSNFTLIP